MYYISDCPAGKYAPNEGSVGCETCNRGTFSYYGSSTCTLCPEGKFANAMGSGSCTLCPSGSYNDSTGHVACTFCPAGSHFTFRASV